MPPADDLEPLIATRFSLHAVAEHVMAPALYAATGRIGLRQADGGFCTPEFPADGGGTRQALIVGTDIVVRDTVGESSALCSTVRTAAQLVGIEAGAPADVYMPTTPLDLDAPLTLDADSARRIADWYALAQAALERLCADLASFEPATIQLWPEHFDLATTIAEVNVGASPGDEHHEVPYLYVGPWSPPEPDGAFWNESFGASRTDTDITTLDQAVEFLLDGWERAQILRSTAE